MSVDRRTRRDGPRTVPDPGVLLAEDLAARWAARTDLGPLLAWLEPPPLTVTVGGRSWTLTAAPGRLGVEPGDRGAAALVCTPEVLGDLAADQQSVMGLFSSGQLDQPKGTLNHLLDWWVVLRAVWDDAPVVLPGTLDYTDDDGRPLDLAAAFDPADEPARLRRFLEQTGYLHLRRVFSPQEMAAVSDDMEAAFGSYADGDGHSWWVTTADGARRLVRLQEFDRRSAATAALLEDPRTAALAGLTGDGHLIPAPGGANRIEALVKPLGVVAGISDVPWHKDCSLGRHSYECCRITAGISVTGADAASGQLKVVAGSHRATSWPAFVRRGSDLPEVPLPTETGDVTLHLSCTLHMAQPPEARERRVLYTSFTLPPPDAAAAEAARAARAVLGQVREAAPVTVSQVPAGPRA
jgi:hypothetical protein